MQIANNLTTKKRTNLSINEKLLVEAKSLNLNLSQCAETGIKEAILKQKRQIWLKENKEAIASSNKYVEQNGLPLDKFRQF